MICKIECVVELCKHRLYSGDIYAQPNASQLMYIKLMDVSSYLKKLLINQTILDTWTPKCNAFITNECQFSASMVPDAMQLVIIDKWSPNTMNSDHAKTILQGGWMVTAIKHGEPRCVNCFSPFYITFNMSLTLEMKTRIPNDGFKFSKPHPFQPQCMESTGGYLTIQCTASCGWRPDNSHQSLITREELWYEDCNNHNSCDVQWKRCEIVQLSDEPIHPGFLAEFRTRHLAGKWQCSRKLFLGNSSSEDDVCSNVDLVDLDIENMPQMYSQTRQTSVVYNPEVSQVQLVADVCLKFTNRSTANFPNRTCTNSDRWTINTSTKRSKCLKSNQLLT